MSITPEEARAMVARAVRRIVPDADVEALSSDADLRRSFELDSLDFLSYVELLVGDSGVRLDEEDYPELTTTAGATDLLVRRSA
jgi:acyl carrier protein